MSDILVVLGTVIPGKNSRAEFTKALKKFPNTQIVDNFGALLDHTNTNPTPKVIILDKAWVESAGGYDMPYKKVELNAVPHILLDHHADKRDPKHYRDICNEAGIKFGGACAGHEVGTNKFESMVATTVGLAPV